MTKRAVLYARVSGDDTKKEGRNLESQIELGEEYAAKRDYKVVAKLREDDKGAKGDDINLPQLNEVRKMAADHQFDVLIVREIDRLSRSLAKQLIVEQELKRQGVEIEYVLGEYPDTPEGNFMRHIRATVAEYEREKINERAVRGRYNKVKSGSVFVSGRAPYGYTLHQDEKGHYYLEIEESEAQIIRKIFEWYLSGLATRKIADRLSDIGAKSYVDNRPSLKGIGKQRPAGQWSGGTVRHILKNETYSGTWYYGKKIGRTSEKRPKDEQLSVSVPAIISKDIWQQAQLQIAKNKSQQKHSDQYDYLLRGVVQCSHCGYYVGCRTAHVDGKVYPYYRCNAYKRDLVGSCDRSSVHYRAEPIDKLVWEWITSLLTNPEQLDAGLEAYKSEKDENVESVRERLELVSEMLAEEREKQTRLLDLYLSGEFAKEMLTERKSRIEAKIHALSNEELELRAILEAQTISDDQIEAVKQFGKEIADELEFSNDDIEAMRYIINLLDVQVKLSSNDDGKFVAIQCGLGSDLLSLKSNSTYDSCPYKNRLQDHLEIGRAALVHGLHQSR